MKYRINQSDWMVQIWDPGEGGFSDFWPVSTWHQGLRWGRKKALMCLQYNRGGSRNGIPRWRVKLMQHRDIRSLMMRILPGTENEP